MPPAGEMHAVVAGRVRAGQAGGRHVVAESRGEAAICGLPTRIGELFPIVSIVSAWEYRSPLPDLEARNQPVIPAADGQAEKAGGLRRLPRGIGGGGFNQSVQHCS